MNLAAGILAGERLALARAITLVENGDPLGAEALSGVASRLGRAHRVGITGPPGCGKSTLVRGLATRWVGRSAKVGIVAVDPSSPFTGGAVLGDRIRLGEIGGHPDVFFRSMASRGALGGLARAAEDVGDLMDAFGVDVLVYETVGVGQSEVEVAEAADTAVVVLSPEAGDGLQAMKAGLLEIADIIVVNKADRPGVEPMLAELAAMQAARNAVSGLAPAPLVPTVAPREEGLDCLRHAVEAHRETLEKSGEMDRRRVAKIRRRIANAVVRAFEEAALGSLDEAAWQRLVDDVTAGRETPASAARSLVERGGRKRPSPRR